MLYSWSGQDLAVPPTDSEPGILACVTSRVRLGPVPASIAPADGLAARPLQAYQLPCLLRIGTSPLPPSENKKTCFATGGVEWGGLSGSRPAPQQGRQRAGSLLLLEWRPGSPAACFLQLSKHGWLGRKPLVCGPELSPLSQQGNNGLDGLGGGGRAAPLFPAPISNRDVLLGGLRPPHLPTALVFHLVGHTVSHHRAKENRGLRKRLWTVAGLLQLWELAELGEGTREGPQCTGSILSWAVCSS